MVNCLLVQICLSSGHVVREVCASNRVSRLSNSNSMQMLFKCSGNLIHIILPLHKMASNSNYSIKRVEVQIEVILRGLRACPQELTKNIYI